MIRVVHVVFVVVETLLVHAHNILKARFVVFGVVVVFRVDFLLPFAFRARI